jgi:multidrug resistance efflux pump
MKKVIIPTILIISAVLILSACSSSSSKTAATATPVVNSFTAGSIIAEGHIQPVKVLDQPFTAPGQIAAVLVKNGDTVTAGQALVQLGDAYTQSTVAQAEAAAAQAQIALDNYKTNADLNLAQAQSTLANAQKAVDDAKNKVTSMSWVRGSNDQIDAADSQKVLAKDALNKAQDFFNLFKNQNTEGANYAMAYSQLAAAQQRYNSAVANLDYLSGHYNSNEAAISAGNLATAQAQLKLAQTAYDKLTNNNGLDPDQLSLLQDQADAAKAAAQAAQNGQSLSASMSGTVVDVAVEPGQSVTAGQVALALADTSKWIVVTDNLTEADVVNVKVGQKVTVRLDALPGKSFSGVVTSIDHRFQVQRGDITYTVTAQLSQTDPAMLWGMTASVEFLP